MNGKSLSRQLITIIIFVSQLSICLNLFQTILRSDSSLRSELCCLSLCSVLLKLGFMILIFFSKKVILSLITGYLVYLSGYLKELIVIRLLFIRYRSLGSWTLVCESHLRPTKFVRSDVDHLCIDASRQSL